MSKKRLIWRRSLSAGLSVLLCLSLLPTAALAADDTSPKYDMNDAGEVLELAAQSETPPTAADYNKAYDLDNDGVLTTWDAKLMLDTLPDLTGLALDKDALTMPVGSKARLNVTYTPSNAYDMRLKWTSNNEAVATVKGGVVTALTAGETTITATSVADSVNPKPTVTCKVTVTGTAPTISAKALQINTKGAGTSEWADLEIQGGKLTVTTTTDSFTDALGTLCENTTRYPNAGALLNGKTLLLQTSYADNATDGVNHIQVQVDPNSFAVPALSKEVSSYRWYDATTLSNGRLLVVVDVRGTTNYFVTADGKEKVWVTAATDVPALLGIASAGTDSNGAEVLYGVTSSGTLYRLTLTGTGAEDNPYTLSVTQTIGAVPTSEMIQSASLLYDKSGYLLVSASYATDLSAGENAGLFYLINSENPACYFDLSTAADGAVFTSLYQYQWSGVDNEGVYLYVEDESAISLTVGGSKALPKTEAYSYSKDEATGLVTNSKLDAKDVKWRSNNNDIVAVNENGTITGVKKGETFIQAWVSHGDGLTTSSNQIKVTVIADTGLNGATVGALVDTGNEKPYWGVIGLGLDVSGNLTFNETKQADKNYTAGGYAQGKLWGFYSTSTEKTLYPLNAETFTASGDPFTTGKNNVRDLTGAPATTVTYSTLTVTDPASLLYVTSKADLGCLGLLGSNGSINAPYQTNQLLVSDYEGNDTLILSAITYAGDLTAAQVREGTQKELSNCDADTPCHVYYALTEDAKLRQLILVPQVSTNGTLSYTLCGRTIATVTGFPSDVADNASTSSMDLLKTADKTYLLVARSSVYSGGSSLWKIDITSYTYAADKTLAATKIGSLDNTTQRVTALYHTGTDVIPDGHILAAAGWDAQPQSLTGAMLSASPRAASAEQGTSGSEDATPIKIPVYADEATTNGLWVLEYDNSKLSGPVVDARSDVLYWSYRHYPRKDSETGIVRIAFAIKGEVGLTSDEDNPLFTVNFTKKTEDASEKNVTVTRKETYDIKVTQSKNGTVTSSSASALVGSTVKLTASPSKDYVLKTIAVTDKNGNNVNLTDKGNGEYAFAMPGVPVTVEAVFVLSGSHIHDFAKDWSYDASQHWHICNNGCAEKDSVAPHSFQWIIDKAATTTATGLKHEECTVCHAKRSEDTVIDKLPSGGSGSSSGGSGGGSSSYPVTVPGTTKNGSVAVSPKNASKGDTVTITVKPDDGFKLDDLTVTDKNGSKLEIIDKGNGKYTFVMPSGKVDIKTIFTEQAEVSPFDDVPNDAYYYEAVKWAQEKEITGGIGNDLFGPNTACTRAQIVTFLWRAAGSPEPKALSSFADVPADAYYAKAVAWAVENGITVGTTAATFSPDDICTRAHGVTFLHRAAKATASAGASAFTDVADSAYYADAVKWATEQGITNGISSTLFGPDEICTRAQIVTFLYRMYGSK